jgi:hypothetical protein
LFGFVYGYASLRDQESCRLIFVRFSLAPLQSPLIALACSYIPSFELQTNDFFNCFLTANACPSRSCCFMFFMHSIFLVQRSSTSNYQVK